MESYPLPRERSPMAPKAKMKAKAKPRPARLRRPAGLARPAAAVDLRSPWMRGMEVKLSEVDRGDLKTDQVIVVTEGVYYGETVRLCGRVRKIEEEGPELHLYLRLQGTSAESILRVHSLDPSLDFMVHQCLDSCSQMETGDRYVHGKKARLVLKLAEEEEWVRNLEKVDVPPRDELEPLREKAAELDQGKDGKDKKEDKRSVSPRSPSTHKSRKKKDKRKKKKKDKKEKDAKLQGRHPSSAAQKEPDALFKGTGLDSQEKVRRRVVHRAKRFASKRRKTSSSSSDSSGASGSSSHGEDVHQAGVFSEDSRAKGIAERFPGVLTLESLKKMEESLLTQVGEAQESSSVRAVATQYFRQQLQRKVSPPVGRELLSISVALDQLVRGLPSRAADTLSQRLKSVEAVAGGAHWSVAQRMELPPSDGVTLSEGPELRYAQKETYESSKSHYFASNPSGRGKGSKGGKDDKGGKGKSDKGKDAKNPKEERDKKK